MYVAIVQPRCLCTVRFTDHLKPSQVKLVNIYEYMMKDSRI